MKLARTGKVPLVILIAFIVFIAMFMFHDQFVSGHEQPTECEVSTVGLSIVTFDENDAVVTEISHGMQYLLQGHPVDSRAPS